MWTTFWNQLIGELLCYGLGYQIEQLVQNSKFNVGYLYVTELVPIIVLAWNRSHINVLEATFDELTNQGWHPQIS